MVDTCNLIFLCYYIAVVCFYCNNEKISITNYVLNQDLYGTIDEVDVTVTYRNII